MSAKTIIEMTVLMVDRLHRSCEVNLLFYNIWHSIIMNLIVLKLFIVFSKVQCTNNVQVFRGQFADCLDFLSPSHECSERCTEAE